MIVRGRDPNERRDRVEVPDAPEVLVALVEGEVAGRANLIGLTRLTPDPPRAVGTPGCPWCEDPASGRVPGQEVTVNRIGS
jgi:hypothetical protein